MKYLKAGKIILWINIVYYFIYKSYFGWNIEAESDVEELCGIIFAFVCGLSLYCYLAPLIIYYELFVLRMKKEHDKLRQND